jgi:iron(III) transport system ATP-binding protein
LTGVTKRFPGRAVAANAVDGLDLEIPHGKLVTLLGPSGCGKTTTLRLIAGLERPDAGEIVIGDRRVCAPAEGTFVGAHQRPIGIVFQSYAIWPHMTVLENVMFPLRVGRSRTGRKEAARRAAAALEQVGLADIAERPAPALSGGQQQRVALARALIREPEVLLLDEPLSNLDASLRGYMRDEIRALQQRLHITTLFVTHDQDEALAISDEVVVMNRGQIVEMGLPQEIYTWPRHEFTATFLGVSNRLPGVVRSVPDGATEVEVAAGRLRCRACEGLAPGDAVSAFMRPESFRLSRRRHSPRSWQGRVEFSIYHGDCWDYHVRVGEQVLKVRSYQEKIGLSHGDQVYLLPDEESAIVIPAGRTDAGSVIPPAAQAWTPGAESPSDVEA